MTGDKIQEVSVTVTTTASVVCPKCGEPIKVKIAGFSENKPEEKKEPTKAQAKEFWEGCGCEYCNHQDGDTTPFMRLPDGQIWGGWGFPIDLNNLFKYAVPRVKYCCLTKPEHKSFNGMWLCEVRLGAKQGHSEDKDPALALFWALHSVLVESKGEV